MNDEANRQNRSRNRRTDATRSRLKAAMIDMMGGEGPGKVTVRELCVRADINRSTFYLHFADIDALLMAIEDDARQALTERLRSGWSEEGLCALLTYMRENAGVYRALLCKPGVERFRRLVMRDAQDIFRDRMGWADDYTAAFMLHGALYAVILWIERGFDIQAQALARRIVELCGE